MSDFSDRQIQIIGEAMKLISESGIQELTIKNLAKRINVSEPALYRHFTNKTEILHSLLDVFKDQTVTLIDTIHTETSDPIETIKAIYLKRCNSFIERPELATVIFAEEMFRNDAQLSQKTAQLMQLHFTAVIDALENGQHEGSIRKDVPAQHLAMCILGTLRLLVTKWRMSGFTLNFASESKKMWQTLARLITADMPESQHKESV